MLSATFRRVASWWVNHSLTTTYQTTRAPKQCPRSSMSAADQGAGPRSGESPASDMPAAGFDSREHVDQEQRHEQHKQVDASHSQSSNQSITSVPPARPTGTYCTPVDVASMTWVHICHASRAVRLADCQSGQQPSTW